MRTLQRRVDGLGWFSLGLGLAALVAPRLMARSIGLSPRESGGRTVLRAFGLREIASGVGILSRSRPTGWVWGRVLGDTMDLALLGRALTSRKARRVRVATTALAIAGVTVVDALAAFRLTRTGALASGASGRRAVQAATAVTVNRPVEEVYRFWRATIPGAPSVLGEAVIIEERPNELLAWRAVQDSPVANAGVVRFSPAPGGRGTEVMAHIEYYPPGGPLGAWVAKLFGKEPGQQLEHELRRLKQLLETGEVARSDASIHRGPHAARPPETPEAEAVP